LAADETLLLPINLEEMRSLVIWDLDSSKPNPSGKVCLARRKTNKISLAPCQ
jgi:hypothetical protein